jgi:hypothetical protein
MEKKNKDRYNNRYDQYEEETVSPKQMVREEYRKKKQTQNKAHDRRQLLRELKEDNYWN